MWASAFLLSSSSSFFLLLWISSTLDCSSSGLFWILGVKEGAAWVTIQSLFICCLHAERGMTSKEYFHASALVTALAQGLMILLCPSHSLECDIVATPWGKLCQIWYKRPHRIRDYRVTVVKGHWDLTKHFFGNNFNYFNIYFKSSLHLLGRGIQWWDYF